MATILYQGKEYQCKDDETILDALLRQGVEIPFSCRNGICHVCMHRAENGPVPPEAQKSLTPAQREDNLFLPCKCKPQADMRIAPVSGGVKQVAKSKGCQVQLPDPEMWAALDEGRLLNTIFKDFYSLVFEDDRLAPFFHGVTQQRAMEKQVLFMRQLFSGEKVYFGDRPRNAHHWMVISDELFDYREELMVDCLRRHGLPEHLVERWREVENNFRGDIVKDRQWNRKMGDVELPVDGYGETVLEIGSLCDGCGEEVDAGVNVRYHLRLGSIYCPSCMDSHG